MVWSAGPAPRRLDLHTDIQLARQTRGADLRNGRINGVLTIPPEFSRRMLQHSQPRLALIEDNTDNFVSSALAATLGSMLVTYNQPAMTPRIGSSRVS